MNDRDIDEILAGAAPPEIDSALLSRVSAQMGASLKPVHPIAPSWVLAFGLLFIAALIAIGGACLFGLYGIRKLGGAEIAAIFSALGILMSIAAMLSVRAMTPGSIQRITPSMLLLIVMVGWLVIDASVFHDYRMDSFVPQGISCLRAGLVVAIPAGVAGWLALHRGFAVNPTSAGLAAGTLAGLAGLTMLELHCPNFSAPHVMVWHTAVIPISAIAGALLAKLRFKID